MRTCGGWGFAHGPGVELLGAFGEVAGVPRPGTGRGPQTGSGILTGLVAGLPPDRQAVFDTEAREIIAIHGQFAATV